MKRRVRIKTEYDGYSSHNVKRDLGELYRVVLWHEKPETVRGEITFKGTKDHKILQQDESIKAVVLQVAIEADKEQAGISIERQIQKSDLGQSLESNSL